MTPFEITILGNNSAIPAHGRHPSAQFLSINHQSILVDCGEGTQIRLMEQENTSLFHISHIFISHIHGDHCLGVMGLMNTMGLLNRVKPLHVFAHASVIQMLKQQTEIMHFRARFKIHYHVVPEQGSGLLVENQYFKVHFFQLQHRVACTGFRFTEKFGKKKIKIEQLKRYRIPQQEWNGIQCGANYTTPDGEVIPHEELTHAHPIPRSYAYCSDTVFTTNFLEDIKGVDMVYIESTYTNSEKQLASERFHCTAEQAATIAKQADVKQLLLGHFSSRYKHLDIFLSEAQPIFEQTQLAIEGKIISI